MNVIYLCQCGRKFQVGLRKHFGRHGTKIVKRPCRCGRELSLVVERDREPGVPALEGQGSLFGQEPEQVGLFG